MIDLFLTLLATMLPLLGIVAVGYYCARITPIPPAALGALLIRLINPVMTFGFMVQIPLETRYLALTPIAFVVSSVICVTTAWASRRALPQLHGIAGLACVSGNSTYFALPLILILMPQPQIMAMWLMLNAGMQIAEAGVGVYVAARTNNTIQESIKRVLRLPPLYVLLAALLWRTLDLHVPMVLQTYRAYAAGAGVFVGMSLLGVTLAQQKRLTVDIKLLCIVGVVRLLVWPLTMTAIVLLAALCGVPFTPQVAALLLLLGLLPLPVNSVAYTSHLGLPTAAIAMAVLLSSFIAMVYTPLMLLSLAPWLGFASAFGV